MKGPNTSMQHQKVCNPHQEAQAAVSPVRKVWEIEVSEHHAGTEQGCKRVCNAFSCNVFAHMPGTLLKNGYIVSHIRTCNQGIAVALITSCIPSLRLESANAF